MYKRSENDEKVPLGLRLIIYSAPAAFILMCLGFVGVHYARAGTESVSLSLMPSLSHTVINGTGGYEWVKEVPVDIRGGCNKPYLPMDLRFVFGDSCQIDSLRQGQVDSATVYIPTVLGKEVEKNILENQGTPSAASAARKRQELLQYTCESAHKGYFAHCRENRQSSRESQCFNPTGVIFVVKCDNILYMMRAAPSNRVVVATLGATLTLR
jgi:hypothetical protein